jgi:hypothetical protein
MKTKTKEIVIKRIELQDSYRKSDQNFEYVYEIETHLPLNLNALDSVVKQSIKVPSSFTEFMEENNISFDQTLEFLNNNYKKK